MLIEEIFSTWLEQNLDFNKSDQKNAIRRLDERQTALRDFLFYGLPLDCYLDVLNDQGINVEDYLLICSKNIEIVLASQTEIEELDFLTNSRILNK